MPVSPYWIAPLLLVCCAALWKTARDRGRLRTACVFLSLWAIFWISSFLPPGWLGARNAIEEVSLALMELAAVLVSAVFVFDLVLRKVHVPKVAIEILIGAGFVGVLFHLLFKLGVNVTGIFATSAVATAVLGLALQDTLGNIASGISLELEDAIQPGCFIICGDVSGWVEHVRLRTTSITTSDNGLVILPNHLLTRSAVTIAQPGFRRFVPFAMPYSVDQQEVINTVESALRSSPVRGVVTEPAPCCVINKLQPGHIEYAAVVWLSRAGDDTIPLSMVMVRLCFALKRAGMPASEIIRPLAMRAEEEPKANIAGPMEILRRTPILRLLEESDLVELSAGLQDLCFAPGENIVRQGEVGDSMYFIVAGRVEIRFLSPDGLDRQVALLTEGDFFGEQSLLTGEIRNSTALALSRVDCYRLDKAGLQGLVERRPNFAEDMSVVITHRQMELSMLRDQLDRETAGAREAEAQAQLLSRIRRFFGVTANRAGAARLPESK